MSQSFEPLNYFDEWNNQENDFNYMDFTDKQALIERLDEFVTIN